MALHFQAGLQAEGHPQRFISSSVIALVIQLVLFYPINRFATNEAKREVESCATNLSTDDLKAFRSKRMVGDVIKTGIFIFFVIFAYKAPQNTTILCVIYFSFILTVLNYFQNYNFAAKRQMKEKG
jgi:uncharacterized membrane protein YjfL (UPF0719 family)